jgi:thiamine pyrophosphokinase
MSRAPVPEAPTVALVVAGGGAPPPSVAALAAPGVFVVAADSGVDRALALGVVPHVVVGDLDSATAQGLAAVTDAGGTIEAHPADKDATDLELALQCAADSGATEIVVVGGAVGRLDHTLAAAAVLCAPHLASRRVTAHFGEARLWVVRPSQTTELHGNPGQFVSLLPMGAPATGVRTIGLRFALDGGVLEPHSARGVSNELTDTHATVTCDTGVLLAVMPGPSSVHHHRNPEVDPDHRQS